MKWFANAIFQSIQVYRSKGKWIEVISLQILVKCTFYLIFFYSYSHINVQAGSCTSVAFFLNNFSAAAITKLSLDGKKTCVWLVLKCLFGPVPSPQSCTLPWTQLDYTFCLLLFLIFSTFFFLFTHI